MTAMMAATAAVVTAARVVLGFLPVCVNTGMRLLTRSELFSPTSQSQQQNSRKSEYETLHTDLVESFSQSTGLTLRTGKSFTIGCVLA
jgi:hypothetical protein